MSRSGGSGGEERDTEERSSEERGVEETDREAGGSEKRARREPDGPGAADWLAASALRIGLTILGIVILLFAVGQVIGFDLLGTVVDALNTTIGRWLLIALVGLFLIVFALKGFSGS